MNYLDEMVRLNPERAVELMYRGDERARRGDVAGTIADFTAALAAGPGPRTAMCLFNRAGLYRAQARWADSIADYRACLEAEPPNARRLHILAGLLLTCPDHGYRDAAGALELARRAEILTDGKDPQVLLALGAAYAETARFGEAAGAWERALALSPEDAGAMSNLARLLASCPDAAVRDGARAIGLARRACELTRSERAFAVIALAAGCAEAGEFEEAVKHQQRALTLVDVQDSGGEQQVLAAYLARRPRRM